MKNHIFEVRTEEDKRIYISWILKIDDETHDKGINFCISHDKSYEILWDIFSHLQEFTIVTEENYVDRVYRDSYYFYYSCKYFNHSRFCRRILLFDGYFDKAFSDMPLQELEDRFIGSIVIRPLVNRSVGRTLLNPRYFLEKDSAYLRITEYDVTAYGKRMRVKAFPYSMQDGETTSCAEITILNLMDYYSRTYQDYHFILPSQISRIAEANSYERCLPTMGLRYELLSKIFSEIGFYPRLYSSQKMKNVKFKRIMHYYIESGIPVALGIKINEQSKHSVIGIGHGLINKDKLTSRVQCVFSNDSEENLWICDSADSVETYCIMDDNLQPYTLLDCKEEVTSTRRIFMLGTYEVEYMMVPLYKRMFLEAADAYDICTSILAHQGLGIRNICSDIGCKDNPIAIRLFMASSRTLLKTRHEQFQTGNVAARDVYNETIFPKFVWVCELYTIDGYGKQAIGEIILDATSSAEAKTDSFIMIHYPGCICRKSPDSPHGLYSLEFEELTAWTPFVPYNGNLFPVE